MSDEFLRKYFKEANNSIYADENLVKKISSLNAQPLPVRKKLSPKIYIPAAAAAVAVISTSISVLPKLLNRDTGDIIEQTVSDSVPSPKAEFSAADALPDKNTASPENPVTAAIPQIVQPYIEQNNSSDTSPALSEDVPYINDIAQITPVSEYTPVEKHTYEPNTYTADTSPQDNAQSYALKNENKTENTYPVSENMSMTENVPIIDSGTDKIVLNINSPELSINRYSTEEYLGGELSYGNLMYSDWTYAQYFQYMNTDFNWSIPNDMELYGHSTDIMNETTSVTLDELGTLLYDSRAFTWEGKKGRYLCIQISKNVNTAVGYLSDDSLTHSTVYGTDAVIIGSSESCCCYIIFNKTAYTVTADNLTEEELGSLLGSFVN